MRKVAIILTLTGFIATESCMSTDQSPVIEVNNEKSKDLDSIYFSSKSREYGHLRYEESEAKLFSRNPELREQQVPYREEIESRLVAHLYHLDENLLVLHEQLLSGLAKYEDERLRRYADQKTARQFLIALHESERKPEYASLAKYYIHKTTTQYTNPYPWLQTQVYLKYKPFFSAEDATDIKSGILTIIDHVENQHKEIETNLKSGVRVSKLRELDVKRNFEESRWCKVVL